MARDIQAELAEVRVAIDKAQQNGGYSTVKIGELQKSVSLDTLYKREIYLETLIRSRRKSGRNYGY